ncbi:hypothetical protein HDU79_008341 [Rhizoclosmatium sp. JEL0117]|nr:hypothetical protein HDU79_008341 [Rhizoclosmatium sp. JEL0117]
MQPELQTALIAGVTISTISIVIVVIGFAYMFTHNIDVDPRPKSARRDIESSGLTILASKASHPLQTDSDSNLGDSSSVTVVGLTVPSLDRLQPTTLRSTLSTPGTSSSSNQGTIQRPHTPVPHCDEPEEMDHAESRVATPISVISSSLPYVPPSRETRDERNTSIINLIETGRNRIVSYGAREKQ